MNSLEKPQEIFPNIRIDEGIIVGRISPIGKFVKMWHFLFKGKIISNGDYEFPEKRVIRLSTKLRIKGTDGIYYLMNMRKDFQESENIKDQYSDVLIKNSIHHLYNTFIIEIYRFQLFGIVYNDIEDSFGSKLFTKDDNQESEQERLKRYLL